MPSRTLTAAPSPLSLAKTATQYMGRVVRREPITETTVHGEGLFALMGGSTVRWTAPASLVEVHVETFNCPQVVAGGRIQADGSLHIHSIRPCLEEEWAAAIARAITTRYDLPSNDPQTEAVRERAIYQLVLSMAVPLGITPTESRRKARAARSRTKNPSELGVAMSNLKKTLMAEHEHRCQSCGLGFPSFNHARLVQTVDDTHVLLCQPCKTEGRLGAVKAVA